MNQQTTIKATAEQADALRRLTLSMSGRLGRRLTLGAAMLAAVTVATNHPDEADAAAPDSDE